MQIKPTNPAAEQGVNREADGRRDREPAPDSSTDDPRPRGMARETLARMRRSSGADIEMTEEWKWMGTPVWSHHGIVCTGEAYTKVVKLTFAEGRIPTIAPLQFKPGRHNAKGDRHPRREKSTRARSRRS